MTSSEEELLKPPEELIAGPRSFASASDMRLKTHVPYNHTEEVSSTRAVPAAKSSEYLASQSSIELNNSSVTKNNTLINLKKLSDSQSFHASSTTAKYDKVRDDQADMENRSLAVIYVSSMFGALAAAKMCSDAFNNI